VADLDAQQHLVRIGDLARKSGEDVGDRHPSGELSLDGSEHRLQEMTSTSASAPAQ
jgi:hypothetical protein